MKAGPETLRTLAFVAVGSTALLASAAVEQRSWSLAAGLTGAVIAAGLVQAWIERATLKHAWFIARGRLLRWRR